jgi:hypothetical protein
MFKQITTFITENKWGLVIVIILCIASFIGGRATISTKPITKTHTVIVTNWLPRKEIHDTIKVPDPYEVKVPSDPKLIHDTIKIKGKPDIIKVDSAAMVRDWTLMRNYNIPIFNIDTIGKADITANVQYNKLSLVGYQFYPITKSTTTHTTTTTTIIKHTLFTPFVFVGTNTNYEFTFDGGLYINNIGVEYDGDIRMINGKNTLIHGVKAGIKFDL